MKKKLKQFFTMHRNADGGFTLVELIVVIAILAILGGVAVPAYSGYVKKANMTADMVLASDVVRAVQTYNYANQLTSNVANNGVIGYIVLTEGGTNAENPVESGVAANGYMHEAMVAAFGESYASTLMLKYDGWTDTATLLNQAASNQYASSVPNSTYAEKIGTEQLLGDVQNCTSSLAGLLGNVGGVDWAQELLKNELGEDVFNSKLEAFGEGDELSTDILANATVFAVADKVLSNNGSNSAVVEDFAEYGFVENVDLGINTNIVDAANWYAALEALVNNMDDPDITAEFQTLNNTMSSAAAGSSDRGNVTGLMNDTRDAILDIIDEKDLWDQYDAYYETPVKDGKTQAQLDGEAYVGVMQSVNNLEQDYISNKDTMSNKDLFTSGELNDRVDSALAAFSLADLIGLGSLNGIALGDSSIVVIFSAQNGALTYSICPANAAAAE